MRHILQSIRISGAGTLESNMAIILIEEKPMAKFKVQDAKLIRVDNAFYPPEKRLPGESAGDELKLRDVQGGTLTGVKVVDGEIIFEVIGRID